MKECIDLYRHKMKAQLIKMSRELVWFYHDEIIPGNEKVQYPDIWHYDTTSTTNNKNQGFKNSLCAWSTALMVFKNNILTVLKSAWWER